MQIKPTLLLAPAARGKTHQAIQAIQKIHAFQPLAPITVVLPNQVRIVEFQHRLAEAGGALGVNLATFHTLYANILARANHPRASLIDPVQIRLLRSIVDKLHRERQLEYFAPLRTKPGFITALRAIIEELKRDRIYPVDLSRTISGMGSHLQEVAAVYCAYQDWLLEKDWVDTEGQGWLAALALENDPQLHRELRLLVVNGFDEFNPTQLRVLTLLAGRASKTLITLTGDLQNPNRVVHRRFQRAQKALTATLDAELVAMDPPVAESPLPAALSYLEAHLFEPAPKPHHVSPAILHFIEAQTRAAEARAALRWVKTCLVNEGYQPSDTAILARDLEPYRAFLQETATEFGIPIRLIGGLSLFENPVVAAILALLSIPAQDWHREPLFAAWRSPYFDWSTQGITLQDIAAFDAIMRYGRVITGLDHWHQAFEHLAQRRLENWNSEDEPGLPLDSDAVHLAEILDAFVTRLTPPSNGSIRDYAAFVEDLIGDDPALASRFSTSEEDTSLRVVARARENPATAERDLAALLAFKDVLRGLVLTESMLETGLIDYETFLSELRGATQAGTYTASAQLGVLVGSVLDARGLSFKAVAILGLSEGEFPKVTRDDPFLGETDRLALRKCGLPIELKLRSDEVTFFYQAITRTRERLLLCRPYLADDGQPWEPSPYWRAVQGMFGNPQAQRVRPEDPLAPNETASRFEWVQAVGTLDLALQNGVSVLRSRISDQFADSQEGYVPDLAASLAARYSSSFHWSASKLETYGTCPFYFFISYALELELRKPPEEGYDASVLGSMLHKVLEQTYVNVSDTTNLQECLDSMPTIARQVFESAPAEYGFRPTPLWEIQQREMNNILVKTITALAEISKDYTPRYFELRFGKGNPALTLKTDLGNIHLHGYIDRVDVGPGARLRIIDYKAGSTPISYHHLQEGRRLQLPIYALAARDALDLGEILSGFYWHIGKAAPSTLKLENFSGGVEAALETAVKHVTTHISSIRQGKFQPKPPKDGCPSYCPAVGFCWRYNPKRY